MTTTRPIKIAVSQRWITHEKIVGLVNAGHYVCLLEDWPWHEMEPDLILHPTAWRWSESMWGYLGLAVREARRAKRGGA